MKENVTSALKVTEVVLEVVCRLTIVGLPMIGVIEGTAPPIGNMPVWLIVDAPTPVRVTITPGLPERKRAGARNEPPDRHEQAGDLVVDQHDEVRPRDGREPVVREHCLHVVAVAGWERRRDGYDRLAGGVEHADRQNLDVGTHRKVDARIREAAVRNAPDQRELLTGAA